MHTSPFSKMSQHVSAKVMRECYNKIFEVQQANTDELKERVFRLRYEVFCIENSFENKHEFPDKLESDSYDAHSSHILLTHRATGESVGTIRVVNPKSENLLRSFPLQNVCGHALLKNEARVEGLCEISRLCISKSFRRRYRDNSFLPAIYSKSNNEHLNIFKKLIMRRIIPYAPLGLFTGAFSAALDMGKVNCVAVMEPHLIRALTSIGFKAENLGSTIDFHGTRQPIVFNLKSVFENSKNHYFPYYNLVSNNGALHKLASQLAEKQWLEQYVNEPATVSVLPLKANHFHYAEAC